MRAERLGAGVLVKTLWTKIAYAFAYVIGKVRSLMVRQEAALARMPVWSRYPRAMHYAQKATTTILVLMMASIWLPRFDAWWQQLLTVVIGVITIAILLGGLFHSGLGFLCDICINRFPLDAPAQAEKRKKRLYAFHFRIKWFYRAFLVYVLSGTIASPMGLARFWGNALMTLSLAPMTYWYGYVFRTHSELKPWCPYCRPNGGGEYKKIDSPDPSELMPA